LIKTSTGEAASRARIGLGRAGRTNKGFAIDSFYVLLSLLALGRLGKLHLTTKRQIFMQNFEQTFTQWLRVKHHLANASLSAYMSDYHLWAAWCQHDLQKIQNPQREHIVEYFSSIATNQKPSTVSRKYKSLHRFYDMVLELALIQSHPLDSDLHQLNPTEFRQGLVRSIKALTEAEIARKTQIHHSDSPALFRDKLVLSLIYDTGLSPSTLVRLCWPYESTQTPGVYLLHNLSQIVYVKAKTGAQKQSQVQRHLLYPLSTRSIAILQIWVKTLSEAPSLRHSTLLQAVLHTIQQNKALTHQVLRQRIIRIMHK
jgi:site-specific recombinase XerD